MVAQRCLMETSGILKKEAVVGLFTWTPRLGIIAMKVMGQDQIVGVYPQYDYARCLRYALSLPITTATVGMPKKEHLKLNLKVVRDFKPYSPEEMQEIKRQASGEIKISFRNFMAGHDDVA